MKTSGHLKNDRRDRAIFIIERIGIGNTVYTKRSTLHEQPALYNLTDTGIVIVTDLEQKIAITMFIPEYEQIMFIIGDRHFPNWLWKRYKANQAIKPDWMRKPEG